MTAKLPPATQSPDLPPLDRSRPSVPHSPGGHFIDLQLLSSYNCATQPCSPRTRWLFPESPTQDDPPPLPPSNQQGGTRIIGGQAAALGAWPWMVSLQAFTYHNNRRYHVCGGTLLSSRWLLTAAHCFRNKKKVTDWRLIFGAKEVVWGSNKPVKPPLQERYVEKIIIHEKYSPGSEANDIALMKITPPVPCGHFIGPGCLPQFRAGPPRIPQTCWVAGWGFLKDNAPRTSPILQEARVDIIDLDLCNSTMWYNGRIRSTNVCAGYPEGKIDTCQRRASHVQRERGKQLRGRGNHKLGGRLCPS
uniref:Acrosin n=1 Tax=Balaenoptera musculus TaxID=9771 RepID=A0A8C0CPM2_BALMU